MKTISVWLVAMGLLVLSGCEEEGWLQDKRVTGSGRTESKKADVNEFTEIDLEGVSNVYVTTGLEQSVTFTAYSNILGYMEARVYGNELVLKFNEDISVNSDKEIRVNITVPELNKVTLSGVGNFYLSGPVQDKIHLQLDGVGNIEAVDLPVYHARVDINGNGNVQVVAKESLSVDIDGLGNVYYQGNPELSTDINGLGEVVQK